MSLATHSLGAYRLVCLTEMILRDKTRKIQREYGLFMFVSMGLTISALPLFLLRSVLRHVPHDSYASLSGALPMAWAALVFFGAISGIDFTPHLQLRRLSRLPVSFSAVYSVDLLLGIAPAYVCLLPLVLSVRWMNGHSVGDLLRSFASLFLFLGSMRVAVALLRAILLLKIAVSRRAIVFGVLATAGICAAIAAAVLSVTMTAYSFSVLREVNQSMCLRISFFCSLLAADFVVQREIVRAGYSPTINKSRRCLVVALESCRSQKSVLYCIAFIGFLRNRNAMMLLLWGTIYGFGYVYWAKISDGLEVLVFVWMVIIYHSYLRANLFGIDYGGIWLVLRDVACFRAALRIKNHTLSFLQCIPITAVLAAFWMLHPKLSRASQTCTILLADSFTSLAVGELIGAFVSVRYAEPIERTSMYSGAMTPGAFVIPVAQAVAMFLVTSLAGLLAQKVNAVAAGVLIFVVPTALFAVTQFLIASSPEFLLSERREQLLETLSASGA